MDYDTKMRRQLYVTLGLSDKEAVIYDLLLQKGEMAARAIELETGYKKNTYVLIKALEKKRLALKLERDRRVYYQPGSPENLRVLAREQLRSAKLHEGSLTEILPELKTAYAESVGRPVVRFVEGAEGLKEVYQDAYNQEIPASYGCLDLEAVERAFPGFMTGNLIPKRVERKSKAYAVLANNPAGKTVAARDKQEMRQSVLLDSKVYPIPAEVSVYGKKVVLLAFRPGGMTGLVIENEEIAQSITSIYRRLFELEKRQ